VNFEKMIMLSAYFIGKNELDSIFFKFRLGFEILQEMEQ